MLQLSLMIDATFQHKYSRFELRTIHYSCNEQLYIVEGKILKKKKLKKEDPLLHLFYAGLSYFLVVSFKRTFSLVYILLITIP